MLSTTVKYTVLTLALMLTGLVSYVIAQKFDLGYAVIIFPLTFYGLLFVLFKLIIGRSPGAVKIGTQKLSTSSASELTYTPIDITAIAPKEIADEDRRVFIKLLGSTGIFLLIYSIINRNSAKSILNGMQEKTGVKLPTDGMQKDGVPFMQTQTQPVAKSPDDFKIAEIDDGDVAYFGYIDKDGEWYIMKADTLNGSFRYIRGEKDFEKSWEKRESLNYQYYHNVF